MSKRAKKRRIRKVEFKLTKRNPADGAGIPLTDGESIFCHPTLTVKDMWNNYRAINLAIRAGYPDRQIWNKACDYVINDMLHNQGIKAPRVPKKFRDKTASEIYRLLSKPKKG